MNGRAQWPVAVCQRRILLTALDEVILTNEGASGWAPTVYVSNHQAYWDGFVANVVTSHFGQDLRLQVSSVVTRDFPLLRHFGVHPVDETDPTSIVGALEADRRHLEAAGAKRAVWIFAQGRYRSPEEASTYFQRGFAHVVRKLPSARLVPVALRYEVLRTRHPVVYVDIGDDVTPELQGLSARACVGVVERRHAELYARQDQRIRTGLVSGTPLLRNRKGSVACGRFFYTADVQRQVRGMRDVNDARVTSSTGGFRIAVEPRTTSPTAVVDFLIDRYNLDAVPRPIVEAHFIVERNTK